jgi:hypothetical protein
MAVVCQQLADGVSDVAFVQEPWVYRGQMSSITSPGATVFLLHPKAVNARPCNFMRKSINALPLLQFCSRDTATGRMVYHAEETVRNSSLPQLSFHMT